MGNDEQARQTARELRKVRQIRQYRPDSVPQALVDELVQIARWTGSSRNSQPWHFVVVDDRETLRGISQLRTAINWVAGAPLGIAIVLDGESDLSEAYDEGRVTERLLIGAHLLGLGAGTAWFGDASQQAEAKRLLSIPEDRMARSIVTVGYPLTAKDPRPNPARGRKPLGELVSRNRFGSAGG
jgi:nitroreductase